MTELTKPEREQIAEILKRRANDIADFKMTNLKNDEPGSVSLALTREITRLRHLAERVNPAEPDSEEN